MATLWMRIKMSAVIILSMASCKDRPDSRCPDLSGVYVFPGIDHCQTDADELPLPVLIRKRLSNETVRIKLKQDGCEKLAFGLEDDSDSSMAKAFILIVPEQSRTYRVEWKGRRLVSERRTGGTSDPGLAPPTHFSRSEQWTLEIASSGDLLVSWRQRVYRRFLIFPGLSISHARCRLSRISR